MKDVFIHYETWDNESVELLDFLGYRCQSYTDDAPDGDIILIDKRMAGWRGWRVALADITWQHHKQMQAWHRREKLDTIACSLYDTDDTCPT